MTFVNVIPTDDGSAASEQVDTARPAIMNRALLLVFVTTFGSAVSFYLLLSVVPLYAASLRAGGSEAGLTTGALMLSTVVAELATPRLVARFGYRMVFAAGLLLLGVPALALIESASIAAILLVSGVRGLGFGIVVVLGSALVASLVQPERRAEALGIYGIVIGIPSVIALPLGVWLAGHAGYPPVFVAGAVAALAGVALVTGLPGRSPSPEPAIGVVAGLRTGALIRPSIVFASTAMAAGVVVTFVPLAVTQPSGNLAAFALFAQASVATFTRWWAGRYGDRRGSAGLVIPSLVAVVLGMLALVFIDSPTAVLVGMVVFGAGFGVAQNATLALMFDRVSASGYGTVSVMWNLAYDAGLGFGATGFGVVAETTGYPTAFALTAALVLGAIAPAMLDRSATRVNASGESGI